MNSSETICSLSTPQGVGAIAVIRISGSETFSIAAKLFRETLHFEKLEANRAKFAEIYEGEQLIDQVVVTKFAAPHSYTGEDIVEISCHGSFYIRQKIVEMLLKNGCRMAQPGEYTMRAFLNGRMDLPQAEAVADLIDSQSEAAHKLAVNQLRGNVSDKLKILRQQFVDLASLLELELDFSEEEVEFADRSQLKNLLSEIKAEVHKLVRSFKLGNNIKNGIPVAIVGKPNVGKSTLLNAILEDERAIVSNIPGTTRDTIEECINLEGITFRFIDTAGIRMSDNEIEQFGIERSYRAVEKADVILYMFDVTDTSVQLVIEELDSWKTEVDLSGKQIVLIANKIDKLNKQIVEADTRLSYDIIYVSAKENKQVEALKKRLVSTVDMAQLADNTLLTNARHYDCMLQISNAIETIEQGLTDGVPTDLLTIDVRTALDALGEVTGTIATDDLLNNIFGKFCIGK